jgi:hypothetical protein
MLRLGGLTCPLLLSTAFLACGGGSAGGDGGLPDGDGGDGGGDGGGLPGVTFRLQIPADTKACTMLNTGDPLENHPRMARVALAAGEIALPGDGPDEFAGDLFLELELAPDGALAVPAGPGAWRRSFEGQPPDERVVFLQERPYTAGARTYGLAARVAFPLVDGAPTETAKLLDREGLERDPGFSIRGGFLDEGGWPPLLSCERTYHIPFEVELRAQNGDVLVAAGSCENPPCPPGMGCAGGVFWGALRQAVFTRGGEARTATELFDLGWTAFHHEGGQSLLVVIDPPLDGVGALHWPRDEGGAEGDTLRYLDADLQPLDAQPLRDVIWRW